ncbi:hypothetical protein L0Y69_02450, partial [bacterium]|nr:hypothetical protein [bacterium]
IGKRLFARNVRKIVPMISTRDITFAKGVGGMRMQIIDKKSRELMFGEGKITGDNIIFNLTPSPGASACIANAYRDVNILAQMPESFVAVLKEKFEKDFF